MATLKRGAALVFLLAVSAAAFPSAGTWRKFRSSKGFSVMYPANWFRRNVSPDRLDIFSSKRHLKAIVIEKGEAEIFVVEPESQQRTFAQVVQYYERGTTVLSHREISKGRRGACGHLEEVVSKEPPVPPEDVPMSMRPKLTDFIYTGLFCQTRGHIVVLMLKNWEGDKRQQQYQKIALHMAKSIQILR